MTAAVKCPAATMCHLKFVRQSKNWSITHIYEIVQPKNNRKQVESEYLIDIYGLFDLLTLTSLIDL